MADVVDVAVWNEAVAELKSVARKYGAAFDLKMFLSGKERVYVECWYNPLVKGGTKNDRTNNNQTGNR